MSLLNKIMNFFFLTNNFLSNSVFRSPVSNKITNTDTVCVCFHKFSNNILKSINIFCGFNIAIIITNSMKNTLSAISKNSFINMSTNYFAIFNFQNIIRRFEIFSICKLLIFVFKTDWRCDLCKNIKWTYIFCNSINHININIFLVH